MSTFAGYLYSRVTSAVDFLNGTYQQKLNHAQLLCDLKKAIRLQNLNLVLEIIHKGLDLYKDFLIFPPDLDTIFLDHPLLQACREKFRTNEDQLAIIRCLVEKAHADVNVRDGNGNTALIYACQGNYKETVQYLISRGADVNVRDEYGSTALTYACTRNYKETVQYLISRGADVNIRDEQGGTALMGACIIGHASVVETLLEAGANPNIRSNQGKTALMYVSEKLMYVSEKSTEADNYKEIVEWLEWYNLDFPDGLDRGQELEEKSCSPFNKC